MQKINARNCEIKEIDLDTEKKFLTQNHKQSYAKSNICYGLFLNDELVMLMSFGKPRFNKNYQWEIIRECSKKNYLIRGGTSKLWKYFIKNNKCHSCICYSYPHNEEFTSHYIDYCNFKNIKKCKPEKKIYFEEIWNNKLKRIDKSILEKHGVDRLLKTKQGQDRSNEQILLDLGFKKKHEDGLSPQVDIYYPFSVLYKVDDLNDKKFYIGMTENKEGWENGYMGGGTKWNRHLNVHPNHEYKRTILKDNFKTPKDLRDAELNEIKKYVLKNDGEKIIKSVDGLMNIHLRTQGQDYISSKICDECGGKNGHHKKGCSKNNLCPECGGTGTHKKGCSKVKPCPECGNLYSHKNTCSKAKRCKECGAILSGGKHKKSCSKYKKHKICNECGGKYNHFKTCSKYNRQKCPICGSTSIHKKTCLFYKEKKECVECKGKNGHHKRFCSKAKPCPECGGLHGQHFNFCSKAKKCPECGYLIQSRKHAKTCSKYKEPKKCEECGGLGGNHKKSCSKYNSADEHTTSNPLFKKKKE